MHWRKCDLWKAGIVVASVLPLLLLMIWVPVSAAGAHQGVLEPATPGTVTVQTTPTVDATVTALNKEKLAQEVQQLKNQNEPDPFGWLRTNVSVLLSTLVVVIGALFGFWQWRVGRRDAQDKELKDRRDAQDKDLKAQAEERFKTAVTALGDEKEGVQIGGAILLRSFRDKSYEQYYIQIFDLAVAYLRLPRTLKPSVDSNTPLPLTPFSPPLITVFQEFFPLARDMLKKQHAQFRPVFLDASHIRLDWAFLWNADLEQVWMAWASLQGTDLSEAKLHGAWLWGADLSGARLSEADLSEADLGGANLCRAILSEANLSKANLSKAILSEAKLMKADLSEADLGGAILSEADLSEAKLHKAKLGCGFSRHGNPLSGAILSKADLSRAILSEADLGGVRNLEEVRSLKGTDLRGVKGLTQEQLEACKAKGAIIDEDSTTSSFQATVTPSSPSQSDDVQASSALPAQGSIPTPDAGESNAAPSQQEPES